MDPFKHFAAKLSSALREIDAEGKLAPELGSETPGFEPPRDAGHGDLATNAALMLAKRAGQPPRALADLIADKLKRVDGVAKVEVAGPGFINLTLDDAYWRRTLAQILA